MAGEWPPKPLPVPLEPSSDRWQLRPWRAEDAPALAAAWADPDVARWLDPPDTTVAAAARWIAGERRRRETGMALDLVIEVAGAVAGEIGFSSFDAQRRACLVGYWLDAEHRGEGLASDALGAAVHWATTELGARAVLAECAPDNVASHRVAERAGFTLLAPDHQGRRIYVSRP